MKAWEDFLSQQKNELGTETVDKWLLPLRVLRFDACNLYLEAKDSFQVMWFEEHIRPKVLKALLNNNKKKVKVHLTVAGTERTNLDKGKRKKQQSNLEAVPPPFHLNFDLTDPFCTFENFISNASNMLAYKLLTSISKDPSGLGTYNPIYIHGNSGTGKTHLLMALEQVLRAAGRKTLYVRAETFTNHVVSAIRLGEMSLFRQTYRNSEILLIDDVQIFSKKGATQEELFHTFNTLHVDGKQIILSANCAPRDLQMIEPRLVSRFEWGIVLPLEPLTKEDIRAVLEIKMKTLNFQLHPKVVDFLLQTFPRGTVPLCKAIKALILRSHLNQDTSHIKPIQLTVPLVKNFLSDLIAEEEQAAITPQKIIQYTAEQFGIRVEDLVGRVQTHDCVLPRQIAMYLCRNYLNTPLLKIGDLFGRDHSTVISSVRVVQNALEQNNNEFSHPYELILKRIRG